MAKQKIIKKRPITVSKSKSTKKAKKKPARKKISSRVVKGHKNVVNRKVKSPLKRSPNNPIIEPNTNLPWESKATFNPAALRIGGTTHILYRAIGESDNSVLGYASSRDGVSMEGRLDKPAYTHESRRDLSVPRASYSSGGGWGGGSEDPRLTLIDKTVFLIYTAFDGWGSVRIALSSISLEDFLDKTWSGWKTPQLISPPGEIHKNWVLFPEKIKGKYAILHSISPEVLIDYIDDLNDLRDGKYVDSHYIRASRRKAWDSWIRGAGPPPIKTRDGWLLIYHAMDDTDPNRYKMGAMLLDLRNPSKVIARSKRPLLEPDERYENEGFKAGVVYCCGAVVAGDELLVYYGGADKFVCVAKANMNEFLNELRGSGSPRLTRVKTIVPR